MAGCWIVDLSEGITTLRFTKRPSLDDICAAIDEVAEKYMSDRRLWDFSAEGLDVTTTQLQRLAEYGRQKFPDPAKVAFAANDNLAYGISRMYQVEAVRDDVSTSMMVFRTAQEARAIRSPDCATRPLAPHRATARTPRYHIA